MQNTAKIPVKIEPIGAYELFLEWNTGEKYSIPYLELRFHCPCAGCVDEMTGQRTLKKESLPQDVRVTGASVVGRYAIHLNWSDGHSTGMYGFDRLMELCQKVGRSLAPTHAGTQHA